MTDEPNVEELLRTRDVLEARVDELLAKCTAIENERRMWKARAGAAREVIDVLVEQAVASRIFGAGIDASEVDARARAARHLHDRIDALEADAWTRCAAVAREIVAAYDRGELDEESPKTTIRNVVGMLREALGS